MRYHAIHSIHAICVIDAQRVPGRTPSAISFDHRHANTVDDLDELDRFLAPFRRLRDPDTLLDEPDRANSPASYSCAVVTSLFIRLFLGVVNNLFTLLHFQYQLYIIPQCCAILQERRRHRYNSCIMRARHARAVRITRCIENTYRAS